MSRLVPLVAFTSVIIAANAVTSWWGIVTVAGVTATAGTWLAGFGFVARDALQERGGTRWVLAAIVAGALLSAGLSPAIAVASGVAFLMSELSDWAVYTPLRARSRTSAALLSNTVGAAIDSALFLMLAGFPLDGLLAQVAVKVAVTSLFVLGVHLAVFR